MRKSSQTVIAILLASFISFAIGMMVMHYAPIQEQPVQGVEFMIPCETHGAHRVNIPSMQSVEQSAISWDEEGYPEAIEIFIPSHTSNQIRTTNKL